MDPSSATSAERELDRARSDYLAVSRGAHLYATEDDHAEAERRAWERLERALMTVQAERAKH
jgi:hypothetical protein